MSFHTRRAKGLSRFPKTADLVARRRQSGSIGLGGAWLRDIRDADIRRRRPVHRPCLITPSRYWTPPV